MLSSQSSIRGLLVASSIGEFSSGVGGAVAMPTVRRDYQPQPKGRGQVKRDVSGAKLARKAAEGSITIRKGW